MKKVFALGLTCLVCLGCQSGGAGGIGSAFSSTPPAAQGTAAGNLAANGTTATPPSAPDNGATSAPVSTLGKIWQAVSFQQPAAEKPAAVSPEMARFNGFVSAITSQTSQLSVSDSPEVTRQKAEAILTTLQDWDSVLAAGRSIGVINDATANMLTTSVQRLAAETQKLVQYAPHPDTINAVKQLGGSLGATYASVQGFLSQGSTLSQSLLGRSPQ